MEERSGAIVGAGVAGLSASVALDRAGISTVVYEQAPAPRADGGTLIMWTNATRALDALGLRESAVALGTVVDGVDFRDWEGKLLWRLPVDELAEKYHSPSIFLRRSDLLQVLLEAVPADRLRCGAGVEGYDQTSQGIRPVLAGAATEPSYSDLLVGADGLRSSIRTQVLGQRDPRSAHHVGWVGAAITDASQWPAPPGESTIVLGNGLRCCTGTLKPRPDDPPGVRTVYWYASEKVSRSLDSHELIDQSRLAELFADCGVPLSGLIDRTPDPIPFWIADRWPVRRWGDGKATLLGDAAHPSTPDLGMGACQAIESAVVLGRCLSDEPDTELALRNYESARYARTALVTNLSRTTAIQSMVTLPGVSALRDIAIRALLPPVTLSQFDTLLGGGV